MNEKRLALCHLAVVSFLLTAWAISCVGSDGHALPTPQETAVPTPNETPIPAPTQTSSTTEPSGKGTWETFEFTSEALAHNLLEDPATRTIYVYLPPGYDVSDKRYPVVFGLHGFLEDPTWLRGMGRQLDALISDGDGGEMILVLPDGDNKLGGSWYQRSVATGDYEGYIVSELVDYVDASYRTLAHRDARGVAGCSMGGNGALHLAFNYPDVFGAAASVSGGYAYGDYPHWEDVRERYSDPVQPDDLDDIGRLPWDFQVSFALAAVAAPNPDNPPFFFDLPYALIDGEAQLVPEVLQKISQIDVYHDAQTYLDQPTRLRGLVIYHGVSDSVPINMARDFSEFLTEQGVEHEYNELDASHCGRAWDYTPLLKFMSDNLAS
jgi:enterochelin esterase-like enzyme